MNKKKMRKESLKKKERTCQPDSMMEAIAEAGGDDKKREWWKWKCVTVRACLWNGMEKGIKGKRASASPSSAVPASVLLYSQTKAWQWDTDMHYILWQRGIFLHFTCYYKNTTFLFIRYVISIFSPISNRWSRSSTLVVYC